MSGTRRRFLTAAGGAAAGVLGLRAGLPHLLRARPSRPVEALSEPARALVGRAFEGLDRSLLWDVHAHCVGLDEERNGTWVNPAMRSHFRPLEKLRFEIYLAAADVARADDVDARYIERLLALQRAANPEGKLLLLAFDAHVTPEGREDLERSPFRVPNDYVLALASEHPELAPCASVHPYRPDALERLDRAADAGAVAVKWLPNAMGIDPASPRCDAFYARLAERRLVLLSHTGVEKAVHAEEAQRLGNPLRLRRALDAGVRVVAAHCATLGRDEDLDAPGKPVRSSFELFLRLMGEERYEGLLFGGLSAVTLVNRDPAVLRELLARPELHPRLVNGSDYPLPAIDVLISPRLLAWQGLLPSGEVGPLAEVFAANPLLGDLVLKRCLRDEQGSAFEPVAFETGRLFPG